MEEERSGDRTVQATYVCDLVLCADDSVLREFTELDVVIVDKRVPERENELVKLHRPHTRRNS